MEQKIRTNSVYRTMYVDRDIAEWKATTGIRWNNIARKGKEAIQANLNINASPQEKTTIKSLQRELLIMRIDLWTLKIQTLTDKHNLEIARNNTINEEEYNNQLQIAKYKLKKLQDEYYNEYEKEDNIKAYNIKKQKEGY